MPYLFTHFTSDDHDNENIYFALSYDGLHYRDLGSKVPAIKTDKGSKGIRDPFMVYDEKLKKYFIIATDLNTSDGDWERASSRGSRFLFVFESQDLCNWSEAYMAEVGIEGAGCVWAPEAVYCREKEAWFVFFASNVQEDGEKGRKQRVYGTFTKDFKNFSETFKYMESETNVIDTDIVYEDGYYYRFSKDETNKVIILERSKNLVDGPFEEVKSAFLSELYGVEGPEAYYIEEQKKWCLIVDQYAGNKGYLPLLCEDLSTGEFEHIDDSEYDLGQRKKRHGGILKISEEEADRMVEHYCYSDEKDLDSLMWEASKVEHVVQDEWIDFRQCLYKLPNGEEIGPVYNYSKHSFSLIVATDEEGRYICVKQYRHGIDSITTEFPAGGIEYKEKDSHEPINYSNIISSEDIAFKAAKRELKEETGYVSEEWKHLLTVPANATLSNSNVHIFFAGNCKKITDQKLDDTEFLNVELITEEELRQRMFGGDFKQSLHILAYYLSKEVKENRPQ
ncbi:NUDIX domain-containing protein [Butyrivibrio proteoclasticus]|uniref:NUDIX domain-containing protein n=1 Tax=Butyrivibrio proteoclasticus TaxID=43305 RepID=UPI000AC24E0B|nr:NUDIX domain-containing protein [Butyrivibrio proteoclasticus]